MADKEVRQKEVTRIYKRDGEVRASTLVKESKKKSAPLHDEFEWRDEVAAGEYRLSQARRIIRVTRVRLDTGEEKRLFNVPPVIKRSDEPTAREVGNEGAYQTIDQIRADRPKYDRTLEQLTAQLRSVEASIRELKRNAPETEADKVNALKQTIYVAKGIVKSLAASADK